MNKLGHAPCYTQQQAKRKYGIKKADKQHYVMEEWWIIKATKKKKN